MVKLIIKETEFPVLMCKVGLQVSCFILALRAGTPEGLGHTHVYDL